MGDRRVAGEAVTTHSTSARTSNSRLSDIDEYGFQRPPDFDYDTYEEFMSRYLSVLSRRARKWAHLLGARETVGRSIKVKRYVRKGIPMKHRGKMWLEVSGAGSRLANRPGYYRSLVSGPPLSEEQQESIRVDLPRTFPDNIYFRDGAGKEGKIVSLGNVLSAFCRHNPGIGYCQGLNYIAGLLLLVTQEEESAFWLLATLTDHILPDYYTPGMEGVQTDARVIEALVKERAPLVWRHIVHYNLTWELLVTKWFVCLYAEVLPIETVLRIWDCLFYEGNKVLMRVAIALVLNNEAKILASQEFVDIVECFKAVTQDANAVDCHTFMETAFKISGSFPRTRLAKLRQECMDQVVAERNARKK
ncbi:growth hormone-regulated TBC protein 1-A-like [Eriocheir sinensis]|uniref:growth hormone-regulated TBC protein 1-A-like n=1 Tax=Eriocheir sinensis TaxID=95602 RepID=UPI0021C89231|nr:growth hormone-regulated TBC protein 1-A-like [Eriocheir sinensis]